jgi:hypothetical protein
MSGLVQDPEVGAHPAGKQPDIGGLALAHALGQCPRGRLLALPIEAIYRLHV